MNRYDIVNIETGATFSYQAESPMAPQPEWGANPVITVTDISYECDLADCRAKREAEYPSFGDWEDARYKADVLGDRTELDRLYAIKTAVKLRWPKPVAPSG